MQNFLSFFFFFFFLLSQKNRKHNFLFTVVSSSAKTLNNIISKSLLFSPSQISLFLSSKQRKNNGYSFHLLDVLASGQTLKYQ